MLFERESVNRVEREDEKEGWNEFSVGEGVRQRPSNNLQLYY